MSQRETPNWDQLTIPNAIQKYPNNNIANIISIICKISFNLWQMNIMLKIWGMKK